MNVLVIGAGIFGITSALKLSESHNVTLIESNDDIMLNASKCNHNRLHFGFHYPRSIETAKQSLDGYKLFYDYFNEEIVNNFENYYMIEKNGKINSDQYENFCNELNIYHIKKKPNINMNFDNIESSYLTKEPIFDYDLIKNKLLNALNKSNVKVILNKKIINSKDTDRYDVIINSTYFNINNINNIFCLEPKLLKLQTVVIPILKYNHDKIGITVMDGNYCSILPNGFKDNKFLLYHVKESVIYETIDFNIPKLWYYGKKIIQNEFIKKNIYDNFIVNRNVKKIMEESSKYFTFLDNCKINGYMQTIRCLPINNNDERLSIFDINEINNKKIISVLSGKITTCFLNADNINNLL